jgi:hypothetical protein
MPVRIDHRHLKRPVRILIAQARADQRAQTAAERERKTDERARRDDLPGGRNHDQSLLLLRGE